MTPVSINLTPEQSAQADAWTDGTEYTFRATQTAPGQFQAVEIGPSMPEEAAAEPEAGAEPAAPAAAPGKNPAIAILIGKGKKPA